MRWVVVRFVLRAQDVFKIRTFTNALDPSFESLLERVAVELARERHLKVSLVVGCAELPSWPQLSPSDVRLNLGARSGRLAQSLYLCQPVNEDFVGI